MTRGVYSLNANVRARELRRPAHGARGQVIGVVFSRSTVYHDVGYALTSPGVAGPGAAAQHHRSAVGTGPCIEHG